MGMTSKDVFTAQKGDPRWSTMSAVLVEITASQGFSPAHSEFALLLFSFGFKISCCTVLEVFKCLIRLAPEHSNDLAAACLHEKEILG